MRRLVAIAVLFGAAAFGTVAHAWSEAGHKIIASIAFRQLTPDEQAKIVAILKIASTIPCGLRSQIEIRSCRV